MISQRSGPFWIAILSSPPATIVMLLGIAGVWHAHDYELKGQYAAAFLILYVPLALLLSLLVSLSIATVSYFKNWERRQTVKTLAYGLLTTAVLFTGYEALRLMKVK